MLFVLLSILLPVTCFSAESPAPPEIPAAFSTAGGSRLKGLLVNDRPLMLRPETGAQQKLDPLAIFRITFGQRPDPNQENEALVALGDMQSDKFDIREKALVRLRALGRAAIRPLRKASSSLDAEVATRARNLLAELTLQNALGLWTDWVEVRKDMGDAQSGVGEISPEDFTLRSRWGLLKFPRACLDSIEFIKADELNAANLAPAASTPTVAQAHPAPSLDAAADRWSIEDTHLLGAFVGKKGATLAMTTLTMDRAPNPDPNAAPDKRMLEIKAGDRLEDAYAAWGALLRAGPDVPVLASEEAVMSDSGRLSLQMKNSDLALHFVMPGTFNAKKETSRVGGVYVVGAIIKSAPRFSIGLAVYDRAGRQLAEVYNTGDHVIPPGAPGMAGVAPSEFLGVRSKIPIVRARFFRAGDAKGQDLVLDDIVFDRVSSVDRPPDFALFVLSSGERLAGHVKAATLEKGVQLEAEFAMQAPPLQVGIEEIERYEPARQGAAAAKEIAGDDKSARPKRIALGTPHAVLLQSGECFRALLLKLDDKDALFMLPGGAELKLPRPMLRKIDLVPAAAEPGELPAPLTVAENEKNGVDFRRREKEKSKDEKPGDKPPEKDKPKKNGDPLQTTQELEAMPDVEILEADMLTGDLTIKDDNGPWTIGLAPVKTLVFPKDPNAKKAAPHFRDWILTLREGSRFEIVLTGISADSITAEMAGGSVTLPSHVIDSIQRQKR